MEYLTIALAKGRLAEKSLALFEKIGITCDEMKEKNRKLIFKNDELKLKFFLAKATDVPTYVEHQAADIGIVGKDTILEEGLNVIEALDLNFGRCKMVVAAPADFEMKNGLRAATKYPSIARDFFYNKKQITAEIIKLNGSVELAPIVGLSDCIVDIVETGTTLKENGLIIHEDVCNLSARLIVNRVSMIIENTRIKHMIRELMKLEELNG